MTETALRTEVIRIALATGAERLNRGTSGNVSAREGKGFLITPTGMAYDVLTDSDVVFVDANGAAHGPRKPSSEWRMHHENGNRDSRRCAKIGRQCASEWNRRIYSARGNKKDQRLGYVAHHQESD